jgi:hypothetical protein
MRGPARRWRAPAATVSAASWRNPMINVWIIVPAVLALYLLASIKFSGNTNGA